MTKAWLCAVLAAVLCLLTACADAPTVIVDSSDTTSTVPTVAVPKGQMTIGVLLGRMGENMTWSSIAPYTHTAVDDTHAVFAVADTYGKECTLRVTYDAHTDTVSRATLSYGDTTVDITDGKTEDIRTIMMAMNA